MLGTVITSIMSFIGTNVDDTFVLAVWFAQVGERLKRRDIIFGQFLGFEILVLVSVLAAYGLSFLPTDQVGWLGVIPIFIGVRRWWTHRFARQIKSETEAPRRTVQAQARLETKLAHLGKWFRPQLLSVALVTISNGAGNLTVYIPLFTEYSVSELVITIIVFMIMTGVWCYIGYRIAGLPYVKTKLERYEAILIPVIFIAIGIYVLVESGVLT